MHRTTLSVLLIPLVALAMLTGCGREKEPTVAFVTNGVASFWVLAQAGANQAAEDLDINVDVRMPDGLVDQNRIIEDLLVNDVLGIAISPIDGVNQNTKLNEAAARTHLITHDSRGSGELHALVPKL